MAKSGNKQKKWEKTGRSEKKTGKGDNKLFSPWVFTKLAELNFS